MTIHLLKNNPVSRALCLVALLTASMQTAAFEWPESAPQEVNIDPVMLDTLVTRINHGNYGTVKSLLVLRHGKLVREEYFNGFDQDDLMVMYSATKSLASTLIGIGIRNGDLPGVNTPIDSIFTDYSHIFSSNFRARQINMRDLLTQRHGFAWDEWSTFFSNPINPVLQMAQAADWWEYVLSRPVTAEPDTVFRYSTGVSNLMGLAIYNQTRMTAEQYAAQHLFPQLEITDWSVEVGLSDVPLGLGINQFQTGMTPTGHGFWMRSTDLAKIGQLYLDGGVFSNHRIIDKQWVKDSWGSYSNHDTDPGVFPENISYGYQWWSVDYQTANGPVTVHRAWGWGGQYIFVIPKYDMVIVSTNGNFNDASGDIRNAFPDLILDGIGEDFDPESDAGITGPWAAPDFPSQGFVLEVLPSTGQVVLFWMTFDPDTGEQMWLIGNSRMQGRRTVLSFLRPVGGSFAGTDQATLEPWGEGELIFSSCTTAQLSYRSEVHDIEGEFPLARLTPNVYCSDQ